MDWLLAEFEGLGEIMTSVSDDTTVMANESVMAILAREGCLELERIAARDYAFPDHSGLRMRLRRFRLLKSLFFVDFGSFPVGKLFRKRRGEG